MIARHEVSLARGTDAAAIAELSRDCIERGLRWSWTPHRVLRCIHDRSINVAVVREKRGVVGFAIMKYGDDEAQLMLFAVKRTHRRRGFATALLSWLEAIARTAGMSALWLQVRTGNASAIAFYRSFGFRDMGVHARYYQGVEDALFMAKDTTLPPESA